MTTIEDIERILANTNISSIHFAKSKVSPSCFTVTAHLDAPGGSLKSTNDHCEIAYGHAVSIGKPKRPLRDLSHLIG